MNIIIFNKNSVCVWGGGSMNKNICCQAQGPQSGSQACRTQMLCGAGRGISLELNGYSMTPVSISDSMAQAGAPLA